MQLRFGSKLTLEQYISQEAWLSASLSSCPLHGDGCRPMRKGYYWRKYPVPLAVARFYCAEAHSTFSLLPDFLSSRYRGTLAEFEEVCALAESNDCVAVANAVRPLEVAVNITAESARRWVSRRVVLFAVTLRVLMGALVVQREGVRSATELREGLACPHALVTLRGITTKNLAAMPPPLGFGPWPFKRWDQRTAAPHTMGAESPAPSG